MEIRRSYDRLISTMGFPIPVRRHLYIESGPRFRSLDCSWFPVRVSCLWCGLHLSEMLPENAVITTDGCGGLAPSWNHGICNRIMPSYAAQHQFNNLETWKKIDSMLVTRRHYRDNYTGTLLFIFGIPLFSNAFSNEDYSRKNISQDGW